MVPYLLPSRPLYPIAFTGKGRGTYGLVPITVNPSKTLIALDTVAAPYKHADL